MTDTTPTQPTATDAPTQPDRPDGVGASSTREGSGVVIIGGGPGGYEAALVARQLGADVTLIERQGLGGSAVLTDVVPSKTLIATAEWFTTFENAAELGVTPEAVGKFSNDTSGSEFAVKANMSVVNNRVTDLAARQSADIRARLERSGVKLINSTGRLEPTMDEAGMRRVRTDAGHDVSAHMVLIATGATPRQLPTAKPDGERILTWTQLYDLDDWPEHLIVIGSGVTGAEFAGAYTQLGCKVTLVSSRDRVLPGEDLDAAELIEEVFQRRGMTVLSRSRAAAVHRRDDGVDVELTDGRVVTGSHCLVAVGAVPNTEGIGLEDAGVTLTEAGHIEVDRVSRTRAFRVYAAGDCTGVLPLASVAAMQGRMAMWHALGDAVAPFDPSSVAANIFTSPEIATVGISQADIDAGKIDAVVAKLPLGRNPRAKMLGMHDGFIKLFADRVTGTVVGGVVVAPRASELIYPITLAVNQRMTVDQVAAGLTIYPSVSGSIAEAARLLHRPAATDSDF